MSRPFLWQTVASLVLVVQAMVLAPLVHATLVHGARRSSHGHASRHAPHPHGPPHAHASHRVDEAPAPHSSHGHSHGNGNPHWGEHAAPHDPPPRSLLAVVDPSAHHGSDEGRENDGDSHTHAPGAPEHLQVVAAQFALIVEPARSCLTIRYSDRCSSSWVEGSGVRPTAMPQGP